MARKTTRKTAKAAEASASEPSAMSQAVAARQAAGGGESYAARYEWNWDAGMIAPKQGAQAAIPDFARHIQFEQEGNTLRAYVPALASGMMIRPQIGSMLLSGLTSENFADWEPFEINMDGKGNIRKAIRWWERDPLVYRCVKILAQLANSAFSVNCDNEDFKDIVEAWTESACGYDFRRQFFTERFRSSMIPIFKSLIPYKPRDYKPGKIPLPDENGNINTQATAEQRATATTELLNRNSQAFTEFKAALATRNQARELHAQGLCRAERLAIYERNLAARQAAWTKGLIPGKYTIMNPLVFDIKGPQDMAWLREPHLRVEPSLRDAIKDPSPEQREIIDHMPVEIIDQIRDGKNDIAMPANVFRIVCGDKQDYELYPTPMVSHCFDALEMKYSLLEMDRTMANSVRNRILMVTIGNDQYPVTDPAECQRLANIFNNPSRNLTLFWNHTLKIAYVEPNVDGFLDPGKYAVCDDQIRTAFGISRILTGTSETAGAIGNSIMNFKGVEEEVNEAQALFLAWWQEEVRMLKAALGVSYEVRGSFDQMNLKDEVKFMAVITQMVMNGLIDEETALDTLRYHFPTIKSRMEAMDKLHKKGLFLPRPSANNLGPAGPPTGGKPANNPAADNNANKRGTSQPKRAAAMEARVHYNCGQYYLVVGSETLAADERQQIADTFGIKTDAVLTPAEYEDQFNRSPDTRQPLPELTVAEQAVAMRQANQLLSRLEKTVAERVEAFKAEGAAAGKRGKYVTANRLASIRAEATQLLIDELQPDDWTDEMWDEWFAYHSGEFDAAGMPDDEFSDLLVAATVAARAAKAKPRSG